MPKQNIVSLNGGLVTLAINTTGSNLNTFDIANIDPARSGVFRVFNAAIFQGNPIGSVVVWSFTQPPNSSTLAVPIPTVDNNGNAITWTVGQITAKDGSSSTGLVSPPWSCSME